MKALEAKALAELSGGEYKAYTCFAYGVGAGLAIVGGGFLGWLAAGVILGEAINNGCG